MFGTSVFLMLHEKNHLEEAKFIEMLELDGQTSTHIWYVLVFIQARIAVKGNSFSGVGEYDEYVPMIDKAVDVGWKKQVSLLESRAPGG